MSTIAIIFFIAYFAHILLTLYFAYYRKHDFFYSLSMGFLPILGPMFVFWTRGGSIGESGRRGKYVTKNRFMIFSIQIALILAIIVFFLMFFERGATRFDLTKDKRYSLDDTTKSLLDNLTETDEQLTVRYYYSPTEIRPRRLQLMPKEIGDLLTEYEEVAPRNFVFEMIEVPQMNLSDEDIEEEGKKEYVNRMLEGSSVETKDDKELKEDATEDEKAAFKIRKFLEDENISDIRELTYEGDKRTYQSFYSAFYITFGSKKPFKFDQVYITEDAQKKGSSVYAFANVLLTKALRQLIQEPLHIGFLVGHDEKHYVYDTTRVLRQQLRINEGFEDQAVDLKYGSLPVPSDIDVLIMHATSDKLPDREQFQIDQFLMKGGKILFFTAPLIPPTNTGRNQFMPAWARGDDSWTNFINKYGFDVNTDNVVFDEKCFIGRNQTGEQAMNFAVNVKGDSLTNHPVCAGITETYLIHNNIVEPNTKDVQPDVNFEPIFKSSTKAWSITLDYTLRQDPLLQYSYSVLNDMLKNPPQNREQFVLAASATGEFNSAFKRGETPKLVDENGMVLDAPAYEQKRRNEAVLTKSSETRIIVMGNSLGYLYWTLQWENFEIISNMINYLEFGDKYLKIEQKTSTFTPLDTVTSDKKTLIRLVVIGAMPLLLIVLGFFLLIYRTQSRYYDQAVFELRKQRRITSEG